VIEDGHAERDSNWDFWSNLPEALHQVTIVMTDRAFPSLRHMHGLGATPTAFINSENKRFWVKFTFKTQQASNLTDAEAGKISRVIVRAISGTFTNPSSGANFPLEALCSDHEREDANTYHIHPFDLTKVWPHADYPLIEVVRWN